MNAATITLDVRPILASGQDPFGEIMAVATDIPEGGTLLLVAPFNPVPLREVLGGIGFASEARQTGQGLWEVTFRRGATPESPAESTAPPIRIASRDGNLHVDARGLGEEAAIDAVLAAASDARPSDRLIAHLDANLDRLYAELFLLGWEAAYVPGDVGEVRLEISRAR